MADRLVGTALQEIAAEGVEGCAFAKLWSLLQATPEALEIHLDDHVKQVVWRSLLNVPGMSFKSSSNVSIQPSEPSIQSLEDAERNGVIVVASQELRDACLGLYDIKHADTQPSQIQHSILERLAKARTAGVTQNQLGKDFKVEGNKLFYILRSLESRGLVVRRSTLVRNRESQRGGGSIVLTNLVHLTRYAKHLTLNSHQRFEISNSSIEPSFSEDPEDGESSKGKQLMINDDLPAMKAICDKLQQAEGKILVVSDLKLTLGYRLSAGHRAWRRLMKRLKEAGFVTIIDAKVGRKVRSCIQLVKPFSEHDFNSAGTTEADTEQQLKGPKRGQVTEQLVELSVDQQIYDMIDQEGQDGLMMMEVWKRMGLNNKRNYYRIQNMTIKHGILFEAENHKRSTLYRLRTLNAKKAPSESEDTEMATDHAEAEPEQQPSMGTKRAQKLPTVRKAANKNPDEEMTVKIDVETDAGNTVMEDPEDSPENNEAPAEEMNVVTTPAPSNFPPASLFRIGQPYPCLTVTTTSLTRETRILERLQEEKFIVRPELHRWLESISNKTTMMDRKTLTRTLVKLQAAGKCKVICLSMPGSTNCGRQRTSEVVLLPDVDPDPLMGVIHDRIRKFDMESRGHGVQREKAPVNSVPVLNRVTRMGSKQKKAPLPSQIDPAKVVALQANGFVPAKMARVRLLHYFLWNYTNDSVGENPNFEFGSTPLLTDGTGYRVFALMSALQAMPLELFLQVIGSNRLIDNLADRCRQGVRICDLPEAEQSVFLENSAGGRLAWLIDILRRLKLIRIVVGHGPVMMQDRWHIGSMTISMIEASLTYAMEENIYMEQPAPQPPLPSLTKDAYDLNPRARHEFSISTKESLDNYWQTLEYFFSGAEPSIARHAFPGSSVPELFGLRSWTSLRIMTVDQRHELIKRMNEGGPEKRKSIQDCAKIAKDLNLTLEQVLRVSYEKNRRLRLQTLNKTEPSFMEAFASHASLTEYAGDDFRVVEQVFTTPVIDVDKDVEEGDDGEDSVNHISIVTKLKPSRSRRFPWSDKLDRVLFFAYARQRALLGAKINRVDWNSMQSLPANPIVCRRRMSILKSETSVKKAILNLCSLLAARYERYCQLLENVEDQAPGAMEDQVPTRADIFDPESFEDADMFSETPLHEQPEYFWDNPDDPSVVAAIDEIIRCKNLARSCYNKPSHNRKVAAASTSNATELIDADVHLDPAQLSSAAGLMQAKRQGVKPAIKPRSKRVRKKVKTKPASLQTLSLEELVHQSVGVANAIEFIKLVFLNSSVHNDDVQLPKSFMDALHQLKESHVFTAFNYLREHNMVASGQGAQSFVLSESFTHNVSSSRFPNSTAEEALAAVKWLQEHKSQIDEDWIPYGIEDQCGQLLHLFAKVSAGEILLAPKVPADGIGESEDPRSIGCGLKRKSENPELCARTVKARLENQEEVYQAVRRERGFPGIDVLLHRQAHSLSDLLTDASNVGPESTSEATPSVMDVMEDDQTFLLEEDSPSLDQERLDTALCNIERAGEEGLSLKELAESLSLPTAPWDLKQAESYAEALESAGHVKMVNAFDHVRVLAQDHAAPYFLHFVRKKTDQKNSPDKGKGIVEQAATTSSAAMDIDVIPDLSNTLPILPWLTSNGTVNTKIFRGLARRVLGLVTLNPGITEEQLVKRMQILNPQTVKDLLRTLQLDGKLMPRKVIYPNVAPPSLLKGHVGAIYSQDFVQQLHYYANPLCAMSL